MISNRVAPLVLALCLPIAAQAQFSDDGRHWGDPHPSRARAGVPQGPLHRRVAPTAFAWADGVLSNTQDLECFAAPGGPSFDYMSGEYIGIYADTVSGYPKVGDVYYLHWVVQALGACDGIYANLEGILPPSTYLAISGQNPVYCFTNNGQINDGSCPQNLQAGTHGYILNPTVSPYAWPLAPGVFIEVQVPVYSTAAIVDYAKGWLQAIDGNISPVDSTFKAPVVVGANAPTITYPVPSATSITDTSARTTANILNHFAAGTFYFDIGTTTSYGTSSAGAAVPNTWNSGQFYQDWTGMTAGTTFHWRGRFVATGGATTLGADQTFTTTGAPPPAAGVKYDSSGDGMADVFWRNSSVGANSMWFMNGPAIAFSIAEPVVADPNFKVVAVGDFDGDRKADILWRNSSTGANIIWFMNGGSIASSALLPTIADPNWVIGGVGDFQGDGKSDILWHNNSTGGNSVWLMNGSTIAASATLPTVSDTNWKIVGIGDLQGDGKDDVVWHHTVTGGSVVWFMNGPVIGISAVLPAVADTTWQIVGVGDFQGDTKADLLWRNSSSGANVIWFMNGGAVAASAVLPTVADTNFKVARVADFQGDGKADIMWRNTSTGATSQWLMNGASVAVSSALPTVPPSFAVVP